MGHVVSQIAARTTTTMMTTKQMRMQESHIQNYNFFLQLLTLFLDKAEDVSVNNLNSLFNQVSLGRPRNLPCTTPGLMLIPPVPYNIPEENQKGVKIEIIFPSSVTKDMLQFRRHHRGWTGKFRLS